MDSTNVGLPKQYVQSIVQEGYPEINSNHPFNISTMII